MEGGRLREFAAWLRRPASSEEILRGLAGHAAAVGKSRADVWLRDHSRPVLLRQGDEREEMPLGAPAPAARAFLERRPVIELPPAPRLALPFFEARRVIGVLTLVRDENGPAFEADEIAQLEMALDVASLALSASRVATQQETDLTRAEAMTKLAAEICSCGNVEGIVERTLATADQLFSVERAAVWLIEPGGSPRAVQRGLPQEFVRNVTESYGKDVNWTSLQALRPVLIRDLSDARAANLREVAEPVGLRSCLMIPLGFRGQLVGVLGLFATTVWPWTDEDVATARSFGLQLGAALAHSRLVGETRRQLTRLSTLAEVGRAAVETLGLDVRCRRVARALVRSGEIDTVVIYQVDPVHGDLVLAGHHPDDLVLQPRVSLSQDGMLTRAMAGARIVTTDDDTPEATREWMQQAGVTHGATMPLVGRGKLLGVFGVGRCGGLLSRDTLDFVRAVADQLVESIEVGRIFEQHAATSARLRSILASVPDGILVLTADARVAFANDRLTELLSYPADITGWTLKDFARELGPRLEDPRVMERIRQHVLNEPHLPHRDEFVIAGPVRRVVERISAPVVGEDGQQIGQVILYHDLTALRS